MTELAKETHIDFRTLQSRIQTGWSVEEAVEIPTKRKERTLYRKLYHYKGNVYSIKDLCKIANIDISQNTLNERLKAGWSIEEALTIPISNCGKRVKKYGL